MRQQFLIVFSLFISAISFGQPKYEWGEKFDFNVNEEVNPQLVLADNYNTYLLTTTNIDGMLSSHKITIRKFDQKNQLVNTFNQELKKLDIGTLYNFLGWKEISANQVVVFAESYSGKEKKKDIYKYVFDKSDGKFTTSLVVSYPIESAMKSGTSVLKVSENGRYIGFINERDGSKKDLVSDEVVILDGTTAGLLWKKEVPLEEKIYDKAFTVTNSGKGIILRAAKGMKLNNYIVVVSQENLETKQFEESVLLHDPKAISIGQADYLIDFNYIGKGLRVGDYEGLMLYDIGNGKALTNNKITQFNTVKDIAGIQLGKVFIQNNEIHLFVQARAKAGTRQVKINPLSSFATEEAYYKFGPSYLIIMNLDGSVKTFKALQIDNNVQIDTYHSFGMVNINGKYYINAGGVSNIYEQPFDNAAVTKFPILESITNDPYRYEGMYYMNQLTAYVKDPKKLILARVLSGNKMSLVSIIGFPQ